MNRYRPDPSEGVETPEKAATRAETHDEVMAALDTLPRPPCAELLGWEVVDARPAEGWIRIRFAGRREFTNPAGVIQGGFLAAMLDDTMGPAVFIATEGRLYCATVDFNVSFMAPAKVGPMTCSPSRAGLEVRFRDFRLGPAADKPY